MVQRIDGLPDGVIGARLRGTVTRDEYDAELLPPLQAAIDAGGPLRYLLQVGPGFDGVTAGAVWDDAKEGLHALRSSPRWERIAVVTDVESLVRTIALFGWMAPGELRTFTLEQRADALAWVAG